MRSPAAAIAWEFRRRHRSGLIVLAGYLLVMAGIRLVFFAPGQFVSFSDAQFAAYLAVPLTSTFCYLLAVFSYGLSGDLAARQSIYPARMFTLPLTSGALAGWPMLIGSGAMALLWLAMRLLAVWPTDVDVPVIWPALLAASLLAWTQALTWMSYALPGLRVIVTVLWLATIDSIVMLALHFKASEPVMLAILAPHIPLAYFTARRAVARARRGEIPDWRGTFRRLGEVTDAWPRWRDRFPSPARAQVWFEWRRAGWSLPAMVAIVLPFELALLPLFRETPPLVVETLLGVLFTPPFMAAFAAATVSKSNSDGSDSYSVTPFLATRPLTSVSLIAARLKVTVRSTLAAWLLVIVAIPIGLKLSGTLPLARDWTRHLIAAVGAPRAIAIVLLGFTGLLASTWKQLVQSLYVGVSGREWAVKASVFLALSFLAVVLPLGHWIVRSRVVMAALWNALPWIAAVLVCVKLSAAAWIAMRLYDSGLLRGRMLVLGAVCWDVAVFALYGLLVWIIPSLLVQPYFLALVAILAIPLARLSAAPLALASNRHR